MQAYFFGATSKRGATTARRVYSYTTPVSRSGVDEEKKAIDGDSERESTATGSSENKKLRRRVAREFFDISRASFALLCFALLRSATFPTHSLFRVYSIL